MNVPMIFSVIGFVIVAALFFLGYIAIFWEFYVDWTTDRGSYKCGRCGRWFPITRHPRLQLARHPGQCPSERTVLDDLAEI